ncbi:MAG: hypothetical protein AAGI03_18335 [Pseudomonadota bacterium]
MRLLIALFILVTSASVASSDEVWETPDGQVVYLSETKGVAVWEIDQLEGPRRIYIRELAGNYDNRSIHEGFWIQTIGEGCGATMTGPDGFSGTTWGRVTVIFHSNGFPTNWTLLSGTCFGEADTPLQGQSPLLQ